MPTKPSSDRTRAAFRRPDSAERPPSPEFWIPTNYVKRTQFTPAPQSKNAERTQFTQADSQLPKANCQKMRNKPNHCTGTACRAPKMRNEPNSRLPGVPLPHIYAKRTQFQESSNLSKERKND